MAAGAFFLGALIDTTRPGVFLQSLFRPGGVQGPPPQFFFGFYPSPRAAGCFPPLSTASHLSRFLAFVGTTAASFHSSVNRRGLFLVFGRIFPEFLGMAPPLWWGAFISSAHILPLSLNPNPRLFFFFFFSLSVRAATLRG